MNLKEKDELCRRAWAARSDWEQIKEKLRLKAIAVIEDRNEKTEKSRKNIHGGGATGGRIPGCSECGCPDCPSGNPCRRPPEGNAVFNPCSDCGCTSKRVSILAHGENESEEIADSICKRVERYVRDCTLLVRQFVEEKNFKPIPTRKKEQQPMAKAKAKANTEGPVIRQPEINNDYLPFLTADHLKDGVKTKATILGNLRTLNGNYGEQFAMDVKIAGKGSFTWAINYDSRTYAGLHKKFGKSEAKWKGTILVERNKRYVNLVNA